MIAETPRLHIVHGNAVAALQRGDIDILGHQVNLRGVMGAGIARQIKGAFPPAFALYREAIDQHALSLGDVQLLQVGPSRWIANIAGQNGIGWRVGPQTDYAALKCAFGKLAELTEGTTLRIGLPYGIGCGLAGGDWDIVSQIIAERLPQAMLYWLLEV